ncbi:hypothetical protein CPT_Mendera_094 [Stenotrophomonas phage Mendera]|uniref:Uncharacterized protein n=1 Tax=Stenotrophomonas phage Mendera TaxID=2650877 RepID=A0A5P8PIX4_9CAUD|nr:hypothetical protein HWC60_gp094 [Stenotrophomonas phage Mendera]QFR56643.1 hypothetical protein CPT_Mendera_094 [Stenotrophomonas phage Mendera]
MSTANTKVYEELKSVYGEFLERLEKICKANDLDFMTEIQVEPKDEDNPQRWIRYGDEDSSNWERSWC